MHGWMKGGRDGLMETSHPIRGRDEGTELQAIHVGRDYESYRDNFWNGS